MYHKSIMMILEPNMTFSSLFHFYTLYSRCYCCFVQISKPMLWQKSPEDLHDFLKHFKLEAFTETQ